MVYVSLYRCLFSYAGTFRSISVSSFFSHSSHSFFFLFAFFSISFFLFSAFRGSGDNANFVVGKQLPNTLQCLNRPTLTDIERITSEIWDKQA